MGRPLMPPALLIRSTAICVPTSAVIPPAAAAPVSGCIVPILYGFAWPTASRHGAGTSSVAPIAPAAVADRPRNVRRDVLPLHHISFAHGASCQRSAMTILLRYRTGTPVTGAKVCVFSPTSLRFGGFAPGG